MKAPHDPSPYPAITPPAGDDALTRLVHLRDLPVRHIVGLMSGTSADATDAALCAVTGSGLDTRVELLGKVSVTFPRPLRERIFALAEADTRELAQLDVLIGEIFADAVIAVAREARLALSDVHLVASHGQTATHLPRSPITPGASLQIGQAAVIAERTGLPVISDFRVRDIAAGGEGAPLVPLVDHLLLRAPGRRRAVQNIGGIANVTLLGETIDDLVAFDNGPGNMALDAVARAASRGLESYDVDGRRGAAGQVDEALLAELNQHPYLLRPPPKSTGRELFGRRFVYPLLDRFRDRPARVPGGNPLDDLLATLTRFSAEAIVQSYREHLPVFPDEVYVSGGGAHNPTLIRHIAELCAPVPVKTTAAIGLDPDAKEAIAFAVLANETLHGHTGNVPRATGAHGPRVLGKITL